MIPFRTTDILIAQIASIYTMALNFLLESGMVEWRDYLQELARVLLVPAPLSALLSRFMKL